VGGRSAWSRTDDRCAEQTYSNCELLLVDNGLDHPLPPWFVDTQKIKVIQEARSGPSPARNAGISAALGSYVAFLDDDDRWLPHKLDVQVRALQSSPEASLCSGDLNMIDEAGDVIGSNITLARSYETVLRTGWGFMPSTMMCALELVRSVGSFDESRRFVEDLDLCIRVLDVGPALVLGEVLADYRRHTGNSSRDYQGMNRASCELLRIERRRAVSERRMDRVLYSLRGEWVTRFVWGKVAFRCAGEAANARAPFREVAAHLLLGLRLNPLAAPAFILQLKQKRALR